MRELAYLFMGEQQHLSDMFVDRHKAFLARVMPEAGKEFEVVLQSTSGWLGPSYRRRTFHEAQERARTEMSTLMYHSLCHIVCRDWSPAVRFSDLIRRRPPRERV